MVLKPLKNRVVWIKDFLLHFVVGTGFFLLLLRHLFQTSPVAKKMVLDQGQLLLMPPPLHLLLLLDRSGHMAKCQPDLAAGLIYAFRPKLTGLKKGLGAV